MHDTNDMQQVWLSERGQQLMGLWSNMHKRRESGKPMRKKGAKGAPTDAAFAKAKLTAKKPKPKAKPVAKRRTT